MKLLRFAILTTLLVSCAHVQGRRDSPAGVPAALWHEAHMALYQQDFTRADSVFTRLALEFPDSEHGREALFYAGSIHLDVRNDAWEPLRAESQLRQYLEQDSLGTLIHRRPEATMLLELARQLTLPPEERSGALRLMPGDSPSPPGQSPVRQSPIARTDELRELQQQIDRLEREIIRKDDEIRRQQLELERIRRALTPPPRPSAAP